MLTLSREKSISFDIKGVIKILLVLVILTGSSVSLADNSQTNYEQQLLETEGGKLATEIMDSLNTSVYRAHSKEQMVSSFMRKYFDELYIVEVKIAPNTLKYT